MNIHLSDEEQEVFSAVKYLPAVSLILSFEPTMSLKQDLEQKLIIMQLQVESELIKNYPTDKAMPVIVKLQNLIHNLNYHTRKKSLAIFVSPIVEKVFYLDFPVQEKMVIDESFEIRDLVYAKKRVIQYLVFLLNTRISRTYLGNCSQFTLIKSNHPEMEEAHRIGRPAPTANIVGPEKHRGIQFLTFLQNLDQGLSLILKAYPLPVFVLGPEKLLRLFKKMTRNEKSLVEFIHGNYQNTAEIEIRELLNLYINDWEEIKERALLLRLKQAINEKKAEYGIQQVWHTATQKNGRLLLVEKNFVYPAHQGAGPNTIFREDFSVNNPFYIKDAVDDVMEKVLESGGDVEFLGDGALKDFGHIALIRVY